MGILKSLGVDKEQILGICTMLETEDMMLEMVDKLEEKNFDLTPQETVNICYQVIISHLEKES